MAFYSIFFLLFLGLVIGFLIPVFIGYFSSGVVERFPTLIACCFSFLVGILCLFSGFLFPFDPLLEKDAKKKRQGQR